MIQTIICKLSSVLCHTQDTNWNQSILVRLRLGTAIFLQFVLLRFACGWFFFCYLTGLLYTGLLRGRRFDF